MQKLHNGENNAEILEPNEGERSLLCSNRSSVRSPSLDFLDTSADTVSEDMILDYLARIISTMYLKQHYGNNPTKKSSNLLPGINERTG